jgi:hypothetical integral membrane protein (TIGR02206 family)
MPGRAGGRQGETMNAAPFETFGTSHVAMLALFVLGIWPVIALGRHYRGRPESLRVSRAFAVLIPCFTIPLQVIDFMPGNYDLQTTLPLQLCDFAWIAAVVALWTHRPTAVALTYYWGLALTTQALITPALNLDFPDPKFIAYWGMHLLIVWAAIFLTFGLGLHPTWREFWRAVTITAAWAVTVFLVNLVLGTNYGFLNRKPATSVLDLLGPWPLYVVVEVALVATVWALMTWPWVRRSVVAGE